MLCSFCRFSNHFFLLLLCYIVVVVWLFGHFGFCYCILFNRFAEGSMRKVFAENIKTPRNMIGLEIEPAKWLSCEYSNHHKEGKKRSYTIINIIITITIENYLIWLDKSMCFAKDRSEIYVTSKNGHMTQKPPIAHTDWYSRSFGRLLTYDFRLFIFFFRLDFEPIWIETCDKSLTRNVIQ